MAAPKEPQRPGFAAHGGANAFEPPLGKPLAKPTHGIAQGVLSRRPAKKPDLAVSMKQMLRRKGGSK